MFLCTAGHVILPTQHIWTKLHFHRDLILPTNLYLCHKCVISVQSCTFKAIFHQFQPRQADMLPTRMPSNEAKPAAKNLGSIRDQITMSHDAPIWLCIWNQSQAIIRIVIHRYEHLSNKQIQIWRRRIDLALIACTPHSASAPTSSTHTPHRHLCSFKDEYSILCRENGVASNKPVKIPCNV
jgi:hypothetical protein